MDIPLKEIVFEPGLNPEFGVFAMSAVGSPAIKEKAIFFNSHTKTYFSMNEEKRTIFGPALVPNMLVYRNNGKEEFNLFATRDTIEKIAVDFAANNRFNNVNLDHVEALTKGITIFQSLLTNENTVPYVKGWEHLEVGTLFYGAKVNNDQVWQDFKDGKYTGWSIHGFFEQKRVSMQSEELDTQEIQAITKQILSTL